MGKGPPRVSPGRDWPHPPVALNPISHHSPSPTEPPCTCPGALNLSESPKGTLLYGQTSQEKASCVAPLSLLRHFPPLEGHPQLWPFSLGSLNGYIGRHRGLRARIDPSQTCPLSVKARIVSQGWKSEQTCQHHSLGPLRALGGQRKEGKGRRQTLGLARTPTTTPAHCLAPGTWREAPTLRRSGGCLAVGSLPH